MGLPPDMPRRLAPWLFSAFNIAAGIAGLGASRYAVPAYAKAAAFLPLNDWAIGFIALGVLIFLGQFNVYLAVGSAAVAWGWWLLWTALIGETVGAAAHVSPKAVVVTAGIAVLHLLLTPYWRRQRRRRRSSAATR